MQSKWQQEEQTWLRDWAATLLSYFFCPVVVVVGVCWLGVFFAFLAGGARNRELK